MTESSGVYCPECDGQAYAGHGEDREWCHKCNGTGFRQVCEGCLHFDFAHTSIGCGASDKVRGRIVRCACPALDPWPNPRLLTVPRSI